MKKQKRKDTLARRYFYGTIAIAGMLLGLKLGGSITWSWWYVTAPFWINVLAALVLVLWAKLWIRVRWKRK